MSNRCFCIESATAVFNDLLQAVERMDRGISHPEVKQWMHGYRDALFAAHARLKVTQGKCCCERYALKEESK